MAPHAKTPARSPANDTSRAPAPKLSLRQKRKLLAAWYADRDGSSVRSFCAAKPHALRFLKKAVRELDLDSLRRLRRDLAGADQLAASRISAYGTAGGRDPSLGADRRKSGGDADRDAGVATHSRGADRRRPMAVVPSSGTEENDVVVAGGNEELARNLVWDWFTDENDPSVHQFLRGVGEMQMLSAVQLVVRKAGLMNMRKKRGNPDVHQTASFRVDEAILGRRTIEGAKGAKGWDQKVQRRRHNKRSKKPPCDEAKNQLPEEVHSLFEALAVAPMDLEQL